MKSKHVKIRINALLLFSIALGMFSLFGSYLIESNSKQLPLSDTTGLTVDNTGNIYIGSSVYGCIQVYDSTGTFLSRWKIPSTGVFYLNMTDNDNVLVYDYRGSAEIIYSKNGKFISHSERKDYVEARNQYYKDVVNINGDEYEVRGFYPKITKNGEVIVEQSFWLKLLTFPQSLLISFIAIVILILFNKKYNKIRRLFSEET